MWTAKMVVYLLLVVILTLPNLMLAQVFPTSTKLTPSPGFFNGTNTATTKSGTCALLNSALLCSGPYVLFDGDVGPSQRYDTSKVFAWDQDFDILFTFSTRIIITEVNLFFHNNPSIAIGLPYIDGIFWDSANPSNQSNALSFTLAGNMELSQNDTRLRNISLIITPDVTVIPYAFLRIHLKFSLTKVKTFLLSEVQLINNTGVSPPLIRSISLLPHAPMIIFGAVNPLPNYNISCTVMNEGSFEWNWTLPLHVQYQVWIADGTRTSVLQLSHITSDYSGNYICRVKYKSQTTFVANSTIALQFPTVIVITPSQAFGMLFDYVTFVCEVYGYSSPLASFSWAVPGSTIPVTTDTLTYQLMNTYGNNSLQNGGNAIGKSPISNLYLRIPTAKDYGKYICLYGGYSAAATLLPPPAAVTTASSATITTTPSMPAANDSGFATGSITGGVVVCTFLLFLVTAGLIVCMFYLKRRNAVLTPRIHEDYSSEPVYSDVSKPEPPPYPAHFFEHTNTYAAVDDNDKYHQGTIADVSPVPPSSSDSCKLQNRNTEFGYVRPNPVYTSVDNLLEANQIPSQRTEYGFQPLDGSNTEGGSPVCIYAKPLPPGDHRRVSSLHDSPPPPLPQPYNPIYSEALSPVMFTGPDQFDEDIITSSNEFLAPYASVYADPEPLNTNDCPLTIDSQNVREVRPLGIGQFGYVVLAETVNLSLKDLKMSATNNDKDVCVLVAMKKLKEDADSTTMAAFEKEIKFMSRLHHENVVRVLGVCLTKSAFIIMEYMENGDLNQYLNKHEFASRGAHTDQHTLSTSTLIYMTLQVAAGMRYLAQRHFIHRDLATRNCLVGAKQVVKIADFGMSRSLYSGDYYKLRGRAMLPIRWMARECFYGKFSQKTDVWAFGVVIWEIFTFSKRQPYDEMTDEEVIQNAIKESGTILLARPPGCPDRVYELMLRCWDNDSESRATFEELFHSLTSIRACCDTHSIEE